MAVQPPTQKLILLGGQLYEIPLETLKKVFHFLTEMSSMSIQQGVIIPTGVVRQEGADFMKLIFILKTFIYFT